MNATDAVRPPHPGPLPEGEGGNRAVSLPIYFVFFLSGAAALTYEISWSRQVGLVLGNTVASASSVLASYFLGMALGYAVAGQVSARSQRPLLMYGLLELAAAGWALLVPLLLSLTRNVGLAAMLAELSPSMRISIQTLLCVLLFLPATTALGGTLPLMASWIEQRNPRSTSRIAWAYGLNTFGGLVGVLIATICMVSVIGVVATSYVAASVSALCGISAILFSFAQQSVPTEHVKTVPPDTVTQSDPQPAARGFALLLLVGISGFATLSLEVLYMRLFALTFHNSTYTFGLVVAVVLFGLAAGAWLAAWAQRNANPINVAGWALLLGSGAVSFSTLLFLNQTGLSYFHGGDTFAVYMFASVGLVTVIVLPPALLLGTVLPLLWDAACQSAQSNAKVVGRLTAVNTLSAAAGALAVSFVLLPLLGLWASFASIATLCLVASVILLAQRSSLQFWATLIAMGCLIFAGWWVMVSQTTTGDDKTLLWRAEGAYGWIDVLKDKRSGVLSLRENINYTHGSTASATWERRQSHLPLLVHPDPQQVLYLGSGTCATAGGATMHEEVQSIVIAELIPEVIDAARMFEKSNLGVLDDPRTEIHLDDARHYLLVTDQRFDVIIADLFVPWESKTGYLYTVDHYDIARERLKPGGIFCQWLPMWQLGEREFEMIVDSFASAFPNTTLWWGKVEYDRSIVGLIGCNGPLSINTDQIAQRMQVIYRYGPEDTRLNQVEDLTRRYIGRWGRREGVVLNTDEHPRLEFAMPLTYANHDTLKLNAMQAYYSQHLSKLPSPESTFKGENALGVSAEDRRAWQQLQLRK